MAPSASDRGAELEAAARTPLDADEIEHLAKEVGLAVLMGFALGDVALDVEPSDPESVDRRPWMNVSGGKALYPYVGDLLVRYIENIEAVR